jgi:hypothetical protein
MFFKKNWSREMSKNLGMDILHVIMWMQVIGKNFIFIIVVTLLKKYQKYTIIT